MRKKNRNREADKAAAPTRADRDQYKQWHDLAVAETSPVVAALTMGTTEEKARTMLVLAGKRPNLEGQHLSRQDRTIREIAARQVGVVAVTVNRHQMSEEDKRTETGPVTYVTERHAAKETKAPFACQLNGTTEVIAGVNPNGIVNGVHGFMAELAAECTRRGIQSHEVTV